MKPKVPVVFFTRKPTVPFGATKAGIVANKTPFIGF
jgi:hypothetical protein